MQQYLQNKKGLVQNVFDRVYDHYDLMNDVMSLGVHRIWKNKFLDWMNPQLNNRLIDVASGTGDIARLYSKKINHSGEIICVEPNEEMFLAGKSNLKKYKNIKWRKGKAEKLPSKSAAFDFYTISYGIRNVTNINLTLSEAFRVLKPGGRFMCLEFSKVNNEILNLLYKKYSKAIPIIGNYIVGSSSPYDYLIKSINDFYSQDELAKLMKNVGFSNVEYRNLSYGISAIHSGWKI